MEHLLYLTHRLPYPPNKGDKISTYHMLRHFSKLYHVHLGTFVDNPDDWGHVDTVRGMCAELHAAPLAPRSRKIASLRGLVNGQPLSVLYYANDGLATWVDGVLARHQPKAIVVYSGTMAQFVYGKVPAGTRMLLDLDDVDSEKWRSYGERRAWPLRSLYAREACRLLEFERKVAAASDATVLVSRDEAELFRRLAPESAHKIHHRTQGVDSDYFNPDRDYPNPYRPQDKVLVFTGAMDYWPNIDAVVWFVEQAFPRIRAAVPEAVFCIVGMNPARDVCRLSRCPGVVVTGAVPDVRPYVHHARAACLPLRIARGIQNKALEAMAMAKPVLATSGAMTGIDCGPGMRTRVADDVEGLVANAVDLLNADGARDDAARANVLARFSWDANLRFLDRLLAGETAETSLHPA